jgi:hypothetical protein
VSSTLRLSRSYAFGLLVAILLLGSGILFCAAGIIAKAQEKDETQSQSSGEVAPGIQLPSRGMVWILDVAQNKPELTRIYVNGASENMHRGGNFARAQVLMKQVVTLGLRGGAAKLRVDSRTPVVFVRKSTEEEEESDSQAAGNGNVPQAHYVLLHLPVVRDSRVVCDFSSAPIAGKPTRLQVTVEISMEQVANGQWWRISPRQPLPDGEYAIAFMPDDKTQSQTEVYDFGIGAPKLPTAKH